MGFYFIHRIHDYDMYEVYDTSGTPIARFKTREAANEFVAHLKE